MMKWRERDLDSKTGFFFFFFFLVGGENELSIFLIKNKINNLTKKKRIFIDVKNKY